MESHIAVPDPRCLDHRMIMMDYHDRPQSTNHLWIFYLYYFISKYSINKIMFGMELFLTLF